MRWKRRLAIAPVVVVIAAFFGRAAFMSFVEFEAASKQPECKNNLRQLYEAERRFFERNHRFTERVHELDKEIPRLNRYRYVLGPGRLENREHLRADSTADDAGVDRERWQHTNVMGGDISPRTSLAGGARLGLSGECPTCTLTIECLEQIDPDPDVDVWSLSTVDRTNSSGARIPAGVPFNDVNDAAWAWLPWSTSE